MEALPDKGWEAGMEENRVFPVGGRNTERVFV